MSSDDNAWLEPTPAKALTGHEPFAGLDASVRDFWSFAFSDLRENIIRGVLAEFLVARAVGSEHPVRAAWDNYDVLGPGKVRIEVKSSAYLQSWRQRKLSDIRFTGLTGLSWDDTKGWGSEREVRADVYVFAVHACQVPDDYDPLDVAQWEFWVAPAQAVREHGARSVGFPFLRAHATGPLAWHELAAGIAAVHAPD